MVYNLKSQVWTRTRIASFCKTWSDYNVEYKRGSWKEVYRHVFTFLLWPCRVIPCFHTYLLTVWFSGLPQTFQWLSGIFFLKVSVPASLSSFSGTLQIYRLPSLCQISSFLYIATSWTFEALGLHEVSIALQGHEVQPDIPTWPRFFCVFLVLFFFFKEHDI